MTNIEERFLQLSNRLNQLCVYKDILQRTCTSISRMECALLQYLVSVDKPVCMNEFSSVLQVSHSRITRIVDNLVKKEYVKRYPSESDRRKWFTEITGIGQSMALQSQKENLDIQNKIINNIPNNKREEVLESMQIYLEALQNVVKEEEGNE